MDELVAWLREQIAESLRIAAEACDNDLTRSSWRSEHPNTDRVEARVMQRQFLVAPDVTDATARHIALNDPDAVLAQCDAHAAIVDFCVEDPLCHDGGWAYIERVLTRLALAYQHCDGYRDEWRP